MTPLLLESAFRRFFLAHFLIGFVAVPVGGVDVHVCDCAPGAAAGCVPGNDGAAGTPADPWRTYERARQAFSGLAPGDGVLFCRGGTWDVAGPSRWTNGACLAAAPCRVGAYAPPWGSGGEARPVLRRTDGGHGFALDDGGAADHEEGYLFSDLDLRGSGSGDGFFVYNDVDDVTLRNLAIDGFAIGVHAAGSNPCSPDPACDRLNDRIILEDSTISNNTAQGWLGGSNDGRIVSNDFTANGSTANLDHNIYLTGTGVGPSRGMRVLGNRLYQSALDGNGVCQGVSLVAHGFLEDLLIEGNEIWEDVGAAGQGCWGIAIDGGYTTPEAFTDVVIRGNVVRNMGNRSIGVGACVRCTIENNVIVHRQPFAVTAISAPDRAPDAGDQLQDDILVRNNSIFVGSGGGGVGIAVDTQGDGHQVVSNAVFYEGSSAFDCFSADLPTSAYDAFDHNLCHTPSSPSVEWADGFGSLAAWQSARGFDLSSSTADPGFANPASAELWASGPGATMVGFGDLLRSSPLDFDGLPRDSAPDAGAFEWGASLLFSDGFESGNASSWDSSLP